MMWRIRCIICLFWSTASTFLSLQCYYIHKKCVLVVFSNLFYFLFFFSFVISVVCSSSLNLPPLPPHTMPRSCVHYSCEAIDCQEPRIRNAEQCSSPGHHFYNGDRCTISCNSGYVLQVHQDDDIIKSQVSIQTHCCTHVYLRIGSYIAHFTQRNKNA